MKNQLNSILIATALGCVGATAEVDCVALSESVSIRISDDKSTALEVVSKEVAAAPGCACEIVKAAIKASQAENQTVAAIVEVAITSAPEQMRLISQCAIAVAPDAIAEIQAVLAKLDMNSGDSNESSKSSKSAKSSKAGVTDEVAGKDWNPLDVPGGDLPPTPDIPPVRTVFNPTTDPTKTSDPNPSDNGGNQNTGG